MKVFLLAGGLAVAALGGCSRQVDAPTSAVAHGRYVGVGHYSPGPMWSQVVRVGAPADAAARTRDDEQVIIVMDTNTGEVRQCGALSGYCIGMNPWAKPLAPGQSAPLAVAKHWDELSAEKN